MTGFKLQRLGIVMEPQSDNPQEIEGVLNPAAVRGPEGVSCSQMRFTSLGFDNVGA